MSDFARTACSEYPNDNPGLHRGAIWFGVEVTGPALVERAQAQSLPSMPSLANDGSSGLPPNEKDRLAAVETATGAMPAVCEEDHEGDDIEIVENMAFEGAVDESQPPPPGAVSSDPFANLVSVVEEVARNAGADEDAMARLACLLGRTRLESPTPDAQRAMRAQALAWQGILRSESDDFGLCGGTMLDEWCAALIATAVGQLSRADRFKRELRRRGVAAFGLVVQAA